MNGCCGWRHPVRGTTRAACFAGGGARGTRPADGMRGGGGLAMRSRRPIVRGLGNQQTFAAAIVTHTLARFQRRLVGHFEGSFQFSVFSFQFSVFSVQCSVFRRGEGRWSLKGIGMETTKAEGRCESQDHKTTKAERHKGGRRREMKVRISGRLFLDSAEGRSPKTHCLSAAAKRGGCQAVAHARMVWGKHSRRHCLSVAGA